MPRTLSGLGAALPTLLDPDHRVDADLQRRLAQRVVANGAEVLLVAGTTGRGAELSLATKAALVELTTPAGVPVVCGVNAGVDPASLDRLASVGAAAVLVALDLEAGLPAAHRLVQQVRSTGMECLAYHHPGHQHLLPPAWYETLASWQVPVKNSDPDEATYDAMRAAGLQVFVGATALLPKASTGAVGVLSGLGSVLLAEVRAAASGDVEAHARLLAVEQAFGSRRITEVEQRARLLASA